MTQRNENEDDSNRWGLVLYRCLAILCCFVGIGICVAGALLFGTNLGDVTQWLPERTTERQTYDEFVSMFGTDDFVVATWPTCQIGSPQCDRFVEHLLRNEGNLLVSDAVSGRDLLRGLVKPRVRDSSSVIDDFSGIYFGEDRDSTCVVIALSEYGMQNRNLADNYVRRCARNTGISEEEFILGGYPQISLAIDSYVQKSFLYAILPCCLLSTFVAWWRLQDFRITVLILSTGGLAAGLSIAFVAISGGKWGPLSAAIPTLTYILCLSGTLHVVNYARQLRSQQDSWQRPFPLEVLWISWKPCVLSTTTTAMGMLSLCRSEFSAIRDFGIYSAIGVACSLVCTLMLAPLGLELIKSDVIKQLRGWPLNHLLYRASTVIVGFLALSIGLGLGIRHLESDLRLDRCFRPTATVLQDLRKLTSRIGPLEQAEVLIQFKGVANDGFKERLDAIRVSGQELAKMNDVSAVLNVAAWTPSEPEGRGVRAVTRRAAYKRRITESRSQLAQTRYLHVGKDSEVFRLSMRLPFFDNPDFEGLTKTAENLARSVVAAEQREADFTVTSTGVSLLYHTAQSRLILDLMRNFSLAFVLILPLMILALRSLRLGVVSMLPNLCPVLIVYGTLGWIGYPLDIGMVIVASIALGIAVDDTTHFIVRFRDTAQRLDPDAAIAKSFTECSNAMISTTLITCFGLVPFFFGELATMMRFAGLLVAFMVAALLCDLLLLPSLMKRFCCQRQSN